MSVGRPDADCAEDPAVAAPAVGSEVVPDCLGPRPCAGAGVSRAVAPVESPAPAAVKACSRSGVELLAAAVPETEAVMVWFDFESWVSSADAWVALQASGCLSTCSVVRLGPEGKVAVLVSGAETLNDLGENNPEVPKSKTRQIFKLRRTIVPKYLKAQVRPQLHALMKTYDLVLTLG